jgi:hypothetical protein
VTEFLIECDEETLAYLRERAEANLKRGKGATTPAGVAMEEILYARNRRRALAKDNDKPAEARRCRHVEAGQVCATCGREGKG